MHYKSQYYIPENWLFQKSDEHIYYFHFSEMDVGKRQTFSNKMTSPCENGDHYLGVL